MTSPEKVWLIDTNVVLRYLLGDHPELSPQAEIFMTAISEGTRKAEIREVVLVECIYVMEKFYRIPRGEIVEKLSAILNFPGIVPSGKSEMLEALLHFRESTLDIVDCLLAAHASDSRPIMSFDKDFQRLKRQRSS
ncbi:MAG: PIN domain-containing protein [Desulfobacterales bacterium]|nr:PIN domain-containing protein [Desulfobacterales bacterium]